MYNRRDLSRMIDGLRGLFPELNKANFIFFKSKIRKVNLLGIAMDIVFFDFGSTVTGLVRLINQSLYISIHMILRCVWVGWLARPQ